MSSTPIYFLKVNPIKRGLGQNLVGSWSYRSGTKIYDPNSAINYNYEFREDVIYSEVVGHESDFDPDSSAFILLEGAERHPRAVLGRDIQLALPLKRHTKVSSETLSESHIRATRSMSLYLTNRYKTVVGFAIHNFGTQNDHAHLLLPDRTYDKDGPGKKLRMLSKYTLSTIEVEAIRKEWGYILNRELKILGINAKVDHRSYKRQGNGMIPTIHIGKGSSSKGRKAVNLNAKIKQHNQIQELILIFQKKISTREEEIERERRKREREAVAKEAYLKMQQETMKHPESNTDQVEPSENSKNKKDKDKPGPNLSF